MTQTLKEILYMQKLKKRIINVVSETLKIMKMPFLIAYVTPSINKYSNEKLLEFEKLIKNFCSDDEN